MNLFVAGLIVFALGLVIGFAIEQIWKDIWNGGKEKTIKTIRAYLESEMQLMNRSVIGGEINTRYKAFYDVMNFILKLQYGKGK